MDRDALTRRRYLAVAAAVAMVAAVLAGIATAGSPAKQQRVAITFRSVAKTFVLTPLTPGPIRPDSGTYTSCCWSRHFFTSDGEFMETDNPTVVMNGRRGRFSWHERITFVNVDNGYDLATAVWTITHGSGAYTHLEGHGREAAVDRKNVEVAAKAMGLLDLKRISAPSSSP